MNCGSAEPVPATVAAPVAAPVVAASPAEPIASPIDTARQAELELQLREAEGRLERTHQEIAVALDELRAALVSARASVTDARAAAQAANAQADASRAESAAARAEAEASRAQAHASRQQADAARQQAEAARQQAEAARQQAETAQQQEEAARSQAAAARAQADAARTEAEQSIQRTTESVTRLRDQAAPLESARQRLAQIEDQVRLEMLAAADMESRAAAARRSLADAELSVAQEREALAAVQRDRQEIAQLRSALDAQCELLRTEEAGLRQSLVELETRIGLVGGELIAAEPRSVPSAGDVLLPSEAEAATGMRFADWAGGLRGLDLRTAQGREFVERLAPLLDRHPDRRALDEWARQGRTVFVLCDTPHEAGRLKELIDVWAEVDPDGVAAIAPAFHATTTFVAAPSRVVRARPTAPRHGRGRRAVGRRSR
ncbi:MAG TPA: hypothetical protein VFF36_11040 [Planctomycetota bacterium]|nr:hypothetical protein [Planctomycetota bacterium]